MSAALVDAEDRAISALRERLQTQTIEDLQRAAADPKDTTGALDLLVAVILAVRRRSGLTVAEFMGRDLAESLGLDYPEVH